jgi:hypothetical protein
LAAGINIAVDLGDQFLYAREFHLIPDPIDEGQADVLTI